MDNGKAAMQANNEQSIHSIAYVPIHQSICHIIPLLDQRQSAAKTLCQHRNRLNDTEINNYEEMIKWCEKKICQHLHFISQPNQ